MVNELQRRIDSGLFGQYPQIGDPRFCTAMFLGSGTRNDLLNIAKAMGLNALLLIQMLPQQTAATGARRPEDGPKIFVVDMLAKVQLERQVPKSRRMSSMSIPTRSPARPRISANIWTIISCCGRSPNCSKKMSSIECGG